MSEPGGFLQLSWLIRWIYINSTLNTVGGIIGEYSGVVFSKEVLLSKIHSSKT